MESHKLLFLKVVVGLVIPQVPCHKGHELRVCTIVITVLCVVLLKSSPEALPSSSAENKKILGKNPEQDLVL